MKTLQHTQSILLIGGPDTGKTHYGGQLLGRLQDSQGQLSLRGSPKNIMPFEEALKCLGQGVSASHTAATTYDEVVLPITLPNQGDVDLIWPDYGGEQIKHMLEQRRITDEWRRRIEQSVGWLLFVRLDRIVAPEDVISRPRTTSRIEIDGEIGAVQRSTQAELVELLQFLLFIKGIGTLQRVTHPSLLVLLSCWDELAISDQHVPPARLLHRYLPLFADFINATWEKDQATIMGLSSLGKPLKFDEPDQEYLDQGPEQFGYVVQNDGEQSTDLTIPLTHLINQSL